MGLVQSQPTCNSSSFANYGSSVLQGLVSYNHPGAPSSKVRHRWPFAGASRYRARRRVARPWRSNSRVRHPMSSSLYVQPYSRSDPSACVLPCWLSGTFLIHALLRVPSPFGRVLPPLCRESVKSKKNQNRIELNLKLSSKQEEGGRNWIRVPTSASNICYFLPTLARLSAGFLPAPMDDVSVVMNGCWNRSP